MTAYKNRNFLLLNISENVHVLTLHVSENIHFLNFSDTTLYFREAHNLYFVWEIN